MKKKTVEDIGEFGCIKEIAHDLVYRPELLSLGVGDDAAVYRIPDGYDELISTDTMVEGLHFTAETMSAADVGYRICAVNFSDMAAMGGEPISFLLSLALPKKTSLAWLTDFYDGVRSCCKMYRVNLVGGDMTGSKQGVVLTGTVVGMVPKGQAVKRSGSRVGNIVFVTGTLGDSYAGLEAIAKREEGKYPFLVERHRRPTPRISYGEKLRSYGVHALNDISDGLSRELREIAESGGVDILIDKSKLPFSKELRKWGKRAHNNIYYAALHGGEDYELVGTISPKKWEKVSAEIDATAIGVVTRKGGRHVKIRDGIHRYELPVGGYDHFRREE